MTTPRALIERCIRSVARDLDLAGYQLCQAAGCNHLPGRHTPDTVHPEITWCQDCGGACPPRPQHRQAAA